MREVAVGLRRLRAAGTPFALATTVSVRGSSPRGAGATMAVDADGVVLGSLSGGCVEGAVYAAAEDVLAGGPTGLHTYGTGDHRDPVAVGLTCGGALDVLVQAVDEPGAALLDEVLADLERAVPVALATVVGGPARLGARLVVRGDSTSGSLGNEGLDVAATDDARGLLAAGQDGTRHYGSHGQRRIDDVTVFVQVFTPPPRMIVFGAIDFASAVVRLGSFLGYRVTVCDARAVFATRDRFPDADEVVVAWPHDYLARTAVDARTVICVLTHDPKFDIPLLELALRGPAAYVGAMGSRRTHDAATAELRERGVTAGELARLHSPIGLDLGARTPEETAVSIAAEIIRSRWGGTGRPLAETGGRIHHDVSAADPASTAA